MRKVNLVYVIGALVATGCAAGGGSSASGTATSQIKIQGRAARGAYLAKGSKVHVRCKAHGNAPDSVQESEIADDHGGYAMQLKAGTDGPCVIRAHDDMQGIWLYSTADGTKNIVNINPYSDMLVRMWYGFAEVEQGNTAAIAAFGDPALNNGAYVESLPMDTLFETGVYPSGAIQYNYCNIGGVSQACAGAVVPDNTPISMPNPVLIAQAEAFASFSMAGMYGIDVQNVLNSNWVAGQGFDALLDSVGIDGLKDALFESILDPIMYSPDVMQGGWATFETVSRVMTFDGYSTRSDLTHISVSHAGGANINTPALGADIMPLVIADSANGVNHYVIDPAFVYTVDGNFAPADVRVLFNGQGTSPVQFQVELVAK